MNIVKRDVTIDIARGIGIILVVFGHTFPIYAVTSFIYSFHMPLFFMLTGFTFKPEKYAQDPWHFLRRYITRLIIPYLIAAICSYLLYMLLAPTLSLPDITPGSAARGIMNGNGSNLPFNNVLCFLPAFFCAGVIFFVLGHVLRGIKLFLGVVLVSFTGIITGLSNHLPFGLDIAMATQFFIYCGHIFKKADWLEKIRLSGTRGASNYIAPAAILVMLVFSAMNGRVDLMTRIYGQPVLFFIAGLSGSVSVLMISLFFSLEGHRLRHAGRLLGAAGRASMYIFISHIPISYCLASAFALLWGLWIYYSFEAYWYLFFIAGLFIPAFVYIFTAFIRNKVNP